MRRVDAEGDSRGVRGRNDAGAKARDRSALRRSTIDELERRVVLSQSTLPTPVALDVPNMVTGAGTPSFGTALTPTANANTPSVAVDPVDPQKMVAVWSFKDTTNPLNVGALDTINSYVEGAYSTDGGVTWNFLGGSDGADVQTDFSQSQSGGPEVFTQTTDASVGFGRDGTVYMLTSTHNDADTDGVLDLMRFDFSGATPNQINFPDGSTMNPVYAWDTVDSGFTNAAATPTLTVDNNLPAFTDTNSSGQTVTQTDPYAGNIYLAWSDPDANAVRMMVSSDEGATFSHAPYVPGSGGGVEPQIAISQGRASGTLSPTDPGVPGGLESFIYDTYSLTSPYATILDQTNTVGGTGVSIPGQGGVPIKDATQIAMKDSPDMPEMTQIPISVNITDPNFTTLQDLDVSLQISYQYMTELSAELIPPKAVQDATGVKAIDLFDNAIDAFGNATGAGLQTGMQMGATTAGISLGAPFAFPVISTVFDDTAANSITAAKAPYTGHFQSEGDQLSSLSGVGLTPTQLDGVWTLQITSFRFHQTFTEPSDVVSDSLLFTSGANPGSTDNGNPNLVAGAGTPFSVAVPSANPAQDSTDTVTGATGVTYSPNFPTHDPVQTPVITPTPSIASDNTYGAYSPHEGRLYAAFTGSTTPQSLFPGSTDTNIYLITSDDGGVTWTGGVQVNDDDATVDGYSGAVPGQTGRTQFEPTVAVDPYTGDVAVSFLDARNDAADARVATYVGVSNDGGATFAPETYANPSGLSINPGTGVAVEPINSVTGAQVNPGPIPDNQSGVNVNRGATAFGPHQSLIFEDGRLIPFWSSNQNMGSNVTFVGSEIVDTVMGEAGGPRITSSTEGPVGQGGDSTNASTTSAGSPVANSFDVTFDTPIDPATFNPDGPTAPIGTGDVSVYYRDTQGDPAVALRVLSITPVPDLTNPLDDGSLGYDKFKVVFAPINPLTGTPTGVGTYSYEIRPSVTNRVRSVQAPTNSTANPSVFGPSATSSPVNATQVAVAPTSVSGYSSYYLQDNAAGLAAGSVSATITVAQVPGDKVIPNVNNLTVQIITPDGKAYDLKGGTVSANKLTLTFTNADFQVPLPYVSIDGLYNLKVIDPTGNSLITINPGWALTVAGILDPAYTNVVAAGPATPSAISNTAISPVPLLAGGTVNPTLNLTVPTGQQIGSGIVTVNLANTGGTGSFDVGDLTATLMGPGSQTFTLPIGGYRTSPVTASFPLPPAFLAGLLSGTYTLSIADKAGDAGTLNSWSVFLQSTETPLTVTANPNSFLLSNFNGNVTGTVSATINVSQPGQLAANANNLTVSLVTPDGTAFPLAGGVVSNGNQTITFTNATFSVPSSAVPLDGTYYLEAVDSTGGAQVKVASWTLTLNALEGAVAPEASDTPSPGIAVSSVTLSGHPDEVLADADQGNSSGVVTATIVASGNAGELDYFVTTPDGGVFPLTGGTLSPDFTTMTFTSVPFVALTEGIPYDGTYTLEAIDPTFSGQTITIEPGWELTPLGNYLTPTLASTPVVQSGSKANVALSGTSAPSPVPTLTLVGHPGQVIGSGTLSISLADNAVGDLTIKLVQVSTGLTFTLANSTGTTLNQTFALPPSFLGTAVDGQYNLVITGAKGTDSGTLASWSLSINPQGFIGSSPAQTTKPLSAATSTVVALNPTGTITSSIILPVDIPAGQQVGGGIVTVFLTNATAADAGGNRLGAISHLTVTLTGPGGQEFTLPLAGLATNASEGILDLTTLSASFQLPDAFLAGELSGLYTLSVTDDTPGDLGSLGTAAGANPPPSWSVTLDSQPIEPLGVSASSAPTVTNIGPNPIAVPTQTIPTPIAAPTAYPNVVTTTSTINLPLTVPTGQVIVGGVVSVLLDNTSESGGIGQNVADLTITLTGPGATPQVFTIPTAGNNSTMLATSLQLPASFLPDLVAGTYTLTIKNGTVGDVGQVVSWSVTALTEPVVYAATSSGVTNINPTGSASSSLTLGVPVSVTIGSGTLSLDLTDTSGGNGNNLADLTVVLTGPGGQTFSVPTADLTGTSQVLTLQLPAAFLNLAAGGNRPLSGIYTLKITDNRPSGQDVGQLVSWGITLQPLATTGTATSRLVVDDILPGEKIASGSVTVDLTTTSGTIDNAVLGDNVADLTVVLTGPGGQTFTLPTSGDTSTGLEQTFQLPGSFLSGLLSGAYTLSIFDDTGADVGQLLSWSVSLAPQSLDGDSMDQNADGIPGEAASPASDGDVYVVGQPAGFSTYAAGTLPLVVSGPHITTTTVAGAKGTTTSASTDNLVSNDTVSSVGVVFDRDVNIASVTPSQVLQLIGPAGPISTTGVKITPMQTYTSTDTPADTSTATTAKTYLSTDASTQIYPSSDATYLNPLALPTSPGSSITSTISIPSTGGTFILSNLEVALSLTYPRDSNISASLTFTPLGGSSSPVTIPLFSGVGGNGANFGFDPNNPNGQAYDYAILSDSGTEPISEGSAPFDSGSVPIDPNNTFATYQPQGKLSAVDGLPLEGTWTLQITNNLGGVAGQFNGWSLIATPKPTVATATAPAGSLQPVEPIPILYTPAPASPNAISTFPSIQQPSPQPLTSTITFPSTGGTNVLASLAANVTLTAPAGGSLADLTGVLVAPNGVEATIFSGGTYLNTTGQATPIVSGTSFSVTPLNAISGLNQFVGIPLDGAWHLEISDDNAGDASDLLDAWSMTTTSEATAHGQPAEPIPFLATKTTPLTPTTPGALSSTISIPDAVAISDLRLRLNISAPSDADLSAVLYGPNGRFIRLFTNVGGSGANFSDTVFDDNASASIDAGSAPFDGTFKPESPLSSFIAGGQTMINGNWTLVVTDSNPNSTGPTAELLGWSLINATTPTSTTANTFQVSFPTQDVSGTYTLTIGSGITAPDSSGTVGVDANLNAGVDQLQQAATDGATQAKSYPSTGAQVIAAGGTLTSSIIVPDNFPVQGVTAAGLPGLALSLSITYPSSPNLSAYLLSPTGQQVYLFAGIGGGGAGTTVSATLEDTAGTPINASNVLISGANLEPLQPLSDYATLYGSYSGGTWKLVIVNAGTSAGTLNSWSLTFQEPVAGTGLGESIADRESASFRIFNDAPTNPAANNTWTAIGPAGVTTSSNGKGTFAGAVATVAVDPSDPTGNTVYVGAASGGIWKTTDFLTTNPTGPTYVPLLNYAPNLPGYSLDVGSIAVIPHNGDPNDSTLIAGTGFGAANSNQNGATIGNVGYPNVDGNSARGIGFLISQDGGATWSYEDPNITLDGNGDKLATPIPNLLGDTTYQIVVDPAPQLTGPDAGKYVVYAALGGPTGGLYRSLDSGATWESLSANNGLGFAACTSLILSPTTVGTGSGPAQDIYAAFEGVGVFQSTNQGQTLQLMAGGLGRNPLIQNGAAFPAAPTTVANAGVSPNGNFGRIVLGKPALTDSPAENIAYQGWLYAAVEGPTGTFNGLYVTKDNGEDWTEVIIPTTPTTGGDVETVAIPNNASSKSYDPTANDPSHDYTQNGDYNLTMTVDPSDPNIIYLGGSQDFQGSGLIRVDITNLVDPHNFTSFSNDRPDNGTLTIDSTGSVTVQNPETQFTTGALYPYNTATGAAPAGPTPYLDLRYAPNDPTMTGFGPFDTNSTLDVVGVSGTNFNNTGTGATWTPFDEPLKANADDLTGSTNLHDSIAYIDPTTGDVRLIFADDQGVFSALVNPDGSINNGIGTDVEANYSRNGNLQDEQILAGATQPSALAAQIAGALFYASGPGLLAAQSSPTILDTGDITWDDSNVLSPSATSPRTTGANDNINSSDRSGVGIATDPTAGGSATNVTATVYEYDDPSLGGNITDFFRVNGIGQTTGLANNYTTQFPFGNTHASGTSGNDAAGAPTNGALPLGNFAVNPVNGSQVLIGSANGELFETTNKGALWSPIGQPGNFDGTQLSALAYGAPDPTAIDGVGNLGEFIYVGTAGHLGTTAPPTVGNPGTGGQIYVTTTGGTTWTDISSGLDGASVVAIYPSPNQKSHEAYAVTLNGVFYSPDTVGLAQAGQTVWTDITGNLDSLLPAGLAGSAPFQTTVNEQGTSQYAYFSSIVADYRYAIPDPKNPGTTYPVLYVSGFGGVFRSLNNGQTWTSFPDVADDGAPVSGGYLPDVQVTSLALDLGVINPSTGHPTQIAGNRELLLATTYGAGNYAIGLAPEIFASTVGLSTNASGTPSLPSGPSTIINDKTPYLTGLSEITNSLYGTQVTINVYDENAADEAAEGTPGVPVLVGTGTTNIDGNFTVQLNPAGLTPAPTPAFLADFDADGTKTLGLQAVDLAGAVGNVVPFTYVLKSSPPPSPTGLVLTSDTGRSATDKITDSVPTTFSVTVPASSTPTVPLQTTTVELFRFNGSSYELVDTVTNVPATSTQTVSLVDTKLKSDLGGNTLDVNLSYYAIQVDQAGNLSTPLASLGGDPAELTITFDNQIPPTLRTPTLDPSTNSGLAQGSVDVTNNQHPIIDLNPADKLVFKDGASANLELFRSIGGSSPQLVGTAAPGATSVQDMAGLTTPGVYAYQLVQVDVAGNISSLTNTPILSVTYNNTHPAAPTLMLATGSDSGLPTHPNVTNVTDPFLQGTGTANLPLAIINQATGQVLARTTVSAGGTYSVQIGSATSPIADGTYTLVALITNAAGNSTASAPLTITIKHSGPQVVPTLKILPADDTGLKGDNVTANHNPRFTGTTDPGDTVKLYALVNGQLSSPQATTTASTINGSFTFQLPNSLTDGTAQLVAQASDVAGNVGAISAPLSIRIISVPGDYQDSGLSQFSVFYPSNETYAVQNVGVSQTVDPTPGRDVPIEYDFNGDGVTDGVGYQFNSATYVGTLSNTSTIDNQYGAGGTSLPVPDYYGSSGTFIYADYRPTTGTWVVALPQPGGLTVNFGVPKVDIPVPAAYDGGGVDEIATFRPVAVNSSGAPAANGTGADSFNVYNASNPSASYQVSFTSAAVAKLGFKYQAGDIPAPADYDGVGRDEFAIYRPSTGQFFILNTPSVTNTATWTLRTVTLTNLPGGPNANDVPASEDYTGDGKADPTVFRPSNSTFYEVNSATGQQTSTQFGAPGAVVAAAGPLLYRLSALKGSFSTNDGYAPGTGGAVAPPSGGATVGGGGGGTTSGKGISGGGIPGGGGGFASAMSLPRTTGSSSTSTPDLAGLSTVALASPTLVTTKAPTVSIPTNSAPAPILNVAVTVGSTTPRTVVPTAATRPTETVETAHAKHLSAKAKAKPSAKAHAVEAKKAAAPAHVAKKAGPTAHAAEPKAKATSKLKAAVTALKGLVGGKKADHKA